MSGPKLPEAYEKAGSMMEVAQLDADALHAHEREWRRAREAEVVKKFREGYPLPSTVPAPGQD